MPRFTLTKAATRGWIGVDLDGTLARYDGWKGAGHVGAPVPAMVDRVKRWLDQGKDVRIFTARAAGGGGRAAIDKFCRDNFGRALPVTAEKDKNMVELWDDRAVGVKANTGEPKCEKGRFYIDLSKSWGAERPGHKYLSRRRNAKGGWEYQYRDEHKAGHDQGAEAEHRAADKRKLLELKKRVELSKKVVVPVTPEQEARREIEHEAKNPKRVPLPGIMHRGGLAALDDFAKSGEV